MAFQRPQHRPQLARPLAQPVETPQQVQSRSARRRSIEESQEWILFSPVPNIDSQSTTSHNPRTATHLSEFGSLETHVRSQPVADSEGVWDDQDDDVHRNDNGGDTHDDDDDDGAELDSLDDGLHAFHHPVFPSSSDLVDQSGGALLPTHDGLGTFTSATGLQETLWQYERLNPRKKQIRRRSSIQRRLDAMDEVEDVGVEDEKAARIEKWRLDQSIAVLDEIEREARRRRRHTSRKNGVSETSSPVDVLPNVAENMTANDTRRRDTAVTVSTDTIASDVPPNESFWQRLTRRVIRDLIGLDENTLSVIFGEGFVDDTSPTPTQPSPIAAAVRQESRVTISSPVDTWETKLLERIARELGILINQFTEHPQSAFATHQTPTQQDFDRAGLAIPQYPPSLRQRRRLERERLNRLRAPSDSLFSPTIPQQTPQSPTEPVDTSLWGIEEEPTAEEEENTSSLRDQQDYWERDVDVKMIFSYLKGRFRSSRSTGSAGKVEDTSDLVDPSIAPPLPASWASGGSATMGFGTSQESLRRAELIRRQHPLVSRAAERAAVQSKRRESLLRRHHMQTLLHKRTGSSSCASQSTKRSRRSRSGSSRHYWDIGGSGVGSGSGPAVSSGLGGWGEV